METPTYVALSRQTGLRREMAVVAHNLANINTTAFKGQRVLFTEYIKEPDDPGTPFTESHGPFSMALDAGSFRDFAQGALEYTGNELDVALQGEGFFTVQGANGPLYSRAGSFMMNPDNQLVDRNGLPVLNDGGQPIVIPPGTGRVEIDERGNVLTPNGAIGRLGIVQFERPQFNDAIGGGLYETDAEPIPVPETTRVLQGAVEKSNVNGITEIVKMIEVQRAYEANARFISQEHNKQQSAIDKLARVA